MATNEGKKFEADFQKSVKLANYFIYRLRDGTASFERHEKAENSKVRFQATNICDFIAYIKGNMYLLELKSVGNKSFAFSLIRENQNKSLSEIDYKGVFAGYLINFRSDEKTYYIPVKSMKIIEDTVEKKSFNISDIEEKYKDIVILISQTKKRTRYTYNIDNLKEIIQNEE